MRSLVVSSVAIIVVLVVVAAYGAQILALQSQSQILTQSSPVRTITLTLTTTATTTDTITGVSGTVVQTTTVIPSPVTTTVTLQPSNESQTTSILDGNVSLPQLYDEVKDSVVTIVGIVSQSTRRGTILGFVEGSGFVYNLTDRMVIVTNNHVVDGASNITVTFRNGDSYPATVLGTDFYADLAVLSTNAPQTEYKPLAVVSSSTLKVGDPVLAIGSPFGLAGSVSTGIVSQLGRTIQEQAAGGYNIPEIIQISVLINPGNSGGPLLNYLGQVVGITTAVVSGSQGLGFAIPSNSILREIASLVNTGSYKGHPDLGITGYDMDYTTSKIMGVSVTYGVLIEQTASGGPADKAGLRGGSKDATIFGQSVTVGGDIIIAINGVRTVNQDDLSTYLEEYTSVGQTINVTIVRNSQTMNVSLQLSSQG